MKLDLYRLRKDKGLSQMDLADILELNQATISRIENELRDLPEPLIEKLEAHFDLTEYKVKTLKPQLNGEAVLYRMLETQNAYIKDLELRMELLERKVARLEDQNKSSTA